MLNLPSTQALWCAVGSANEGICGRPEGRRRGLGCRCCPPACSSVMPRWLRPSEARAPPLTHPGLQSWGVLLPPTASSDDSQRVPDHPWISCLALPTPWARGISLNSLQNPSWECLCVLLEPWLESVRRVAHSQKSSGAIVRCFCVYAGGQWGVIKQVAVMTWFIPSCCNHNTTTQTQDIFPTGVTRVT